MRKRILFTIAYDGTAYYGWQKQKNAQVPTVEGTFEKACRLLFRQDDLECIGASRTDRGVHALGQRAVLDVDTTIPTEKIPLAIRSFLPNDIVVTETREVSPNFHPRYDCIQKTYEYKIYNKSYPNPLYRHFSEFIPMKLDIMTMQKCALQLIGKHNFQSFCASGSQAQSTVRTIFDCQVCQEGEFIRIRVTGDGFLYHMVRILAGTLIEAGMGKRTPQQVKEILLSTDRTKAGKTAEPQGLTLLKIDYGF